MFRFHGVRVRVNLNPNLQTGVGVRVNLNPNLQTDVGVRVNPNPNLRNRELGLAARPSVLRHGREPWMSLDVAWKNLAVESCHA